MIHFAIRSRLLPLMRRKRSARLWMGLALCWLVGCLTGLAFIAVDAVSGWLPPGVLLFIVVSGVVAAMVIWMRLRRSKADWRGCAQVVETRYPELNGRLLTAIEQRPDKQGQFSYLQRRLFDEVIAHNRLLNWDALFPASRVGYLKLVHALIFAVFLVVCLRLGIMQHSTVWGTSVATGVEVTPGDASVERGDSLVVMVRFNERVPSSADLVVHQEGEPERRIPLVRSLDDPIFGGSVAEITDDLTYIVEYAGRSSRDFEVTVFDYPRLERADANLAYPDYTALPPKRIEDTRRITAVEGTQLELTLQMNKPVVSAQLVPRDEHGETLVLDLLPEHPVVQLTGLVLQASERYSLQLVDADGRANKQSVSFVFNVLSNRVPDMQITAPRGDIRPSALEEVTYGGTVFDDFGVLAYGLAYSISGQELRTVELGLQVSAKEKQAFEHVIPFEDLDVQPDDLVSWFFWSEDIGPDGEIRRTMGDLYFAEVRAFEEIFRQGQSQFDQGNQQQPPGGGGGGGGGATESLAEMQQQIIHATWKLQRQRSNPRRQAAGPPQSSIQTDGAADPASNKALNGFLRSMLDSSKQTFGKRSQFFGQRAVADPEESTGEQGEAGLAESPEQGVPVDWDTQVVMDAQRDAISQAREARQQQQDPRQAALWDEAIKQMESALEQFTQATNSPTGLQDALASQQAAYQRLLRLQEREFSVSRNRNQNNSGNQGGRQQQLQRQLDQLDLTEEENRYETESLAQAPQSGEQREQLQVMNRLAELARRQQDINERMQELQTALLEAQTEAAREQLRRELKRLQEEQQEMLADVDELGQRMDSQENQSQFTEQREQLEQTREAVQRAAEAAEQGAVSQALASGTRAQRELQEMREELRNQSASAFAEDMRQMRSDARELSRQQAEVQDQLEELGEEARKSLGDSDGTAEVRERLAQQSERLTNLVDRATQLSELAEAAEPLMSSALYETLREFSQDDLGAVKQVQEDLLANGMFPLYQRLKKIAEESGAKTLDMTSEVLGEGYLPLANQTGQRAQQDIDELARGIERAAERVLGDDTEALRLAQRQLENLTEQLEDEIERAVSGQTNSQSQASALGGAEESSSPQNSQEGAGQSAQGNATGQNADSQASGEGQEGQLAGDGGQQPGQGQNGDRGTGQQVSGEDQAAFDLDQFLGGGQGGGDQRSGPITGNGFGPWSDRLREVEELVDVPGLRNELVRAREQVRQLRREFTRDQQKPDWAQVKLEIVEPLVEVRKEIGEELARRQSRESLVPIDRDPVPGRYSELVRRYYEELGRDNN